MYSITHVKYHVISMRGSFIKCFTSQNSKHWNSFLSHCTCGQVSKVWGIQNSKNLPQPEVQHRSVNPFSTRQRSNRTIIDYHGFNIRSLCSKTGENRLTEK